MTRPRRSDHGRERRRPRRWLPLLLGAAIVPALAAAAPAGAGTGKATPEARARARAAAQPGHAAAARFLALAAPSGQLVEVDLHGRLLEVLVKRAMRRADAELAAILEPLDQVRAVIAEVAEDRVDAAREEVASTANRLEHDGWERFVRVRDEGGDLCALVHFKGDDADGDDIDGLIVMGFSGDREVIFVSLAGVIDLERIAVLGTRLGVPGLDDLPETTEIEERRASRRGEDRE
jgi:hypothetical protein